MVGQQRRQVLHCALALLFSASSCKGNASPNSPTLPSESVEVPTSARSQAAPSQTYPTSGGAEVRFGSVSVQVKLARTADELARGLGGHASLGEREGMLFIFPTSERHSFWMKGMTFPLDIIWIENEQVVYVLGDVAHPPPATADPALPIYTPPAAASYVLEVPAGFAARWGIRTGSHMNLHGISPQS